MYVVGSGALERVTGRTGLEGRAGEMGLDVFLPMVADLDRTTPLIEFHETTEGIAPEARAESEVTPLLELRPGKFRFLHLESIVPHLSHPSQVECRQTNIVAGGSALRPEKLLTLVKPAGGVLSPVEPGKLQSGVLRGSGGCSRVGGGWCDRRSRRGCGGGVGGRGSVLPDQELPEHLPELVLIGLHRPEHLPELVLLIKRRLQGVTTPNQQTRDNFRVLFESGLLEFLPGVLPKNITPKNASRVGPHEESGSPDDVPVETKHLAASAGEPLAGQDFIIVVGETLLLLDDVPIEKLLHSVWPVVQEAGRPVLDGSDIPEKMDRQGSRFWDVSGHGFSTQINFEIN
nr:hypothetical protein Iba_chr13bCG12750 [Ipomoea batatas]